MQHICSCIFSVSHRPGLVVSDFRQSGSDWGTCGCHSSLASFSSLSTWPARLLRSTSWSHRLYSESFRFMHLQSITAAEADVVEPTLFLKLIIFHLDKALLQNSYCKFQLWFHFQLNLTKTKTYLHKFSVFSLNSFSFLPLFYSPNSDTSVLF